MILKLRFYIAWKTGNSATPSEPYSMTQKYFETLTGVGISDEIDKQVEPWVDNKEAYRLASIVGTSLVTAADYASVIWGVYEFAAKIGAKVLSSKSVVSIIDDVADDSSKAVKAGDELAETVTKGSGGKFSKIPETDYNSIRNQSVHNSNVDSITLGKYNAEGKSYIGEAQKTNSSYFDLGDDWGTIKSKYNLTDQEMFDYFNKPFLEDAVNSEKTIKFSHDPRQYDGFLADEWTYLRSRGYSELILEGDVWIAK